MPEKNAAAVELARKRWHKDATKLDVHLDQIVKRYDLLTAEQRARIVNAENARRAADGGGGDA
jgi:hypothetical protein